MLRTLTPDQSIQAALDQAQPGAVFTLMPGTYRERLTLTIPGVTLLGHPDAVVVGGDPVGGWEPATAVGSGVWQTTQIPYTPWGLHWDERSLWRINEDTMRGAAVYGCGGDGFWYLTRPQSGSYTGNIGATVQSYWDGIAALWGHLNGVTYVRFGDGRDPTPLGLTSAPAGAVVTVEADGVTLSGLTIGGGETQVRVSGAQQTRIESCTLYGGRRRLHLDGAGQTTVHDCECYSTALGYGTCPPGEWERDCQDYAYVVKAHQYNENKFCVGRTTEEDTNVYLNGVTATCLQDCVLHTAMVGVACWGGSGTVVHGCVLYQYGAQAVWLHDGASHAEIGDNLLYDAEHLVRVQSCEDPRVRTYYFYHNQCWQARPDSQSPKHLHTSFEGVDGQAVSSAVELWVYHNSFAGGGWALDAGTSDHQLPQLRAVNNIFSTRGIASGGGNASGVCAANWSCCGFGAGADEGNVASETRLWADATLPDFVVPADSTAASGALDVSQPFTIGGVTYAPLPGCPTPQAAFGARQEPAPPRPPVAPAQYLVAARLHGLGAGTYTVRVAVLDATGQPVASSDSAALTVTNGTPGVDTPIIVPLP